MQYPVLIEDIPLPGCGAGSVGGEREGGAAGIKDEGGGGVD